MYNENMNYVWVDLATMRNRFRFYASFHLPHFSFVIIDYAILNLSTCPVSALPSPHPKEHTHIDNENDRAQLIYTIQVCMGARVDWGPEHSARVAARY